MRCEFTNVNFGGKRKFLVKNLDFVKYGVPHRIKQGYICYDDDRVVRVRIMDKNAFLTLKSAATGFARYEFEYEIPVADAEKMLQELCRKPIIDKTRFDKEVTDDIRYYNTYIAQKPFCTWQSER